MLFRFISNDEYEELTNPDHVNEAMENNFERFGDGTIQSESKKPLYAFYGNLDQAFDLLDDKTLTHLVAINDSRVGITTTQLKGHDIVTIDRYNLMDVLVIWKGTRKHALERVYEDKIFPYENSKEDEDYRQFRRFGKCWQDLKRPSEINFPEQGDKILYEPISDRYVAIQYDNYRRRFEIKADALGYGFKTRDSCYKFITKSHDKYYNAQAGSSHLETAYEQASYCGFGDYSDYC